MNDLKRRLFSVNALIVFTTLGGLGCVFWAARGGDSLGTTHASSYLAPVDARIRRDPPSSPAGAAAVPGRQERDGLPAARVGGGTPIPRPSAAGGTFLSRLLRNGERLFGLNPGGGEAPVADVAGIPADEVHADAPAPAAIPAAGGAGPEAPRLASLPSPAAGGQKAPVEGGASHVGAGPAPGRSIAGSAAFFSSDPHAIRRDRVQPPPPGQTAAKVRQWFQPGVEGAAAQSSGASGYDIAMGNGVAASGAGLRVESPRPGAVGGGSAIGGASGGGSGGGGGGSGGGGGGSGAGSAGGGAKANVVKGDGSAAGDGGAAAGGGNGGSAGGGSGGAAGGGSGGAAGGGSGGAAGGGSGGAAGGGSGGAAGGGGSAAASGTGGGSVEAKPLDKAKVMGLLQTAKELEDRHTAFMLKPALTAENKALTAYLPKSKAVKTELSSMLTYIIDDTAKWAACGAPAACAYAKSLNADMALFRDVSGKNGFDALTKTAGETADDGVRASGEYAAAIANVRSVGLAAAFHEKAAPVLSEPDRVLPGITASYGALFQPSKDHESKAPMAYYRTKMLPACPGTPTASPPCVAVRRVTVRGHFASDAYAYSYKTRLTNASNALTKPAWSLMAAGDKTALQNLQTPASTQKADFDAFLKRVSDVFAGAADDYGVVGCAHDIASMINTVSVPSFATIGDANAADSKKTRALLDAVTASIGTERGYQDLIERLKNAAAK